MFKIDMLEVQREGCRNLEKNKQTDIGRQTESDRDRQRQTRTNIETNSQTTQRQKQTYRDRHRQTRLTETDSCVGFVLFQSINY